MVYLRLLIIRRFQQEDLLEELTFDEENNGVPWQFENAWCRGAPSPPEVYVAQKDGQGGVKRKHSAEVVHGNDSPKRLQTHV
jgi:hypothetical protein